MAFLASVKRAAAWEPWLLAVAIVVGCISLGRLFEGRRLWRLEAARLLSVALLALAWGAYLAPAQWWVGVAVAGFCLGSLLGLRYLLRGAPFRAVVQ